jgi:glutathione S-transferase
MKLYYNPKSRAAITKWMLDECGADYELVLIDFEKREHKSPEFLKINPAGKLPALADGEVILFENAAICLYLAEKFPAAHLTPKKGTAEYGRYLSLMVYSTSQLEPAMGDGIMGVETPAWRGWGDYESVKSVIEDQLGEGPWLFGSHFTAADVMIGSMFVWSRTWGKGTGREKLEAYTDRLQKRQAETQANKA